MRRINAGLARHRLATLIVGTALMLGVIGLSAHQALPEHHVDSQDVVCIASLAIAVLAATAWRSRCAPAPVESLALLRPVEVPSSLDPSNRLLAPRSRAGPAASVVSQR